MGDGQEKHGVVAVVYYPHVRLISGMQSVERIEDAVTKLEHVQGRGRVVARAALLGVFRAFPPQRAAAWRIVEWKNVSSSKALYAYRERPNATHTAAQRDRVERARRQGGSGDKEHRGQGPMRARVQVRVQGVSM